MNKRHGSLIKTSNIYTYDNELPGDLWSIDDGALSAMTVMHLIKREAYLLTSYPSTFKYFSGERDEKKRETIWETLLIERRLKCNFLNYTQSSTLYKGTEQ